ncbi:ctr copper transporter [Wuchereria bancrofti]|uniref:Copper transport protein n=1 Tax=Wuchereria bancrofti TaxID=6293 RepID=J9FDK7_WUCBA|nr:ctr copper transporter [Wuchereria bancrofti]
MKQLKVSRVSLEHYFSTALYELAKRKKYSYIELSVLDKTTCAIDLVFLFAALRLYFARNRAVELQNQRIQSNIVIRESSEHVDSVSTEMNSYSSILRFSGFRALKQLFTFYRIVQSSLYFAQILLAYTLMLIAMTFNVWIILGIVFGEATGYFLFSEEPTSNENIETSC